MKKFSTRLLAQYWKDVEKGRLVNVASQENCVQRLGVLLDELATYSEAVSDYNQKLAQYRRRKDEVVRQIEQDRHREVKDHRGDGRSVLQRIKEFWEPGPGALHPSASVSIDHDAIAREQHLRRLLGPAPEQPTSPKGLYVYGPVGTGKTMLMDRFHSMVEDTGLVSFSRRLHFNAAMMEVHSRMHAYESVAAQAGVGEQNSGDQAEKERQVKRAKLAVRRLRQTMRTSKRTSDAFIAKSNASIFSDVARSLMRETTDSIGPSSGGLATGVLCFDEINVNDPFTALALKGIFEALIEDGTVIVATSNRPPWELNHFGVHEAVFAHFIERLSAACDNAEVSCADFRRQTAGGKLGGHYLCPLTPENNETLEQLWQQAVAAEGVQEQECIVSVPFGRKLKAKYSAGGVARFSFAELCDTPKGSSDYYAIAKQFHTVFVTDVPVMSFQKRNLARRFITLLDELYNARVKLICTAEVPPEQLFSSSSDDDQPTFDASLLEDLQFESAAAGSGLRRNVLGHGGVAPVFSDGSASLTNTFLGGLEEKFAFARAISRLYEMSSM